MTYLLVILWALGVASQGIVKDHALDLVNHEAEIAGHEPHYCHDSIHGAINDFTLKLTRLIDHDESFFISPLGISMALTLAYFAAGGQTANQMDDVLEYMNHGLVKLDIVREIQPILESLYQDKPGDLFMADGLFLQKGFDVDANYAQDMRQVFNATVEYLNFAGDGDKAVQEINSWVSEKTEQRITSLFGAALEARTRMILLSTAFFQGVWQTPFPLSTSQLADFHKSDGTIKIVQMMVFPKVDLLYLEDGFTEYKFLELPYKGHLALLIALPSMIDAQADLELTSEMLCAINGQMKLTDLRGVTIPRFRVEFRKDLRQMLESLGMTDLFRNCAANLTSIRPEGDLHLDAFIHQAIVDVAEGPGTEVGDQMLEDSFEKGELTDVPEYPKTFVVNHPFLFYVVDNSNGLVLFSGRVTEPDYSHVAPVVLNKSPVVLPPSTKHPHHHHTHPHHEHTHPHHQHPHPHQEISASSEPLVPVSVVAMEQPAPAAEGLPPDKPFPAAQAASEMNQAAAELALQNMDETQNIAPLAQDEQPVLDQPAELVDPPEPQLPKSM